MNATDRLSAHQRQHLHVVETPAHQEWRARQALSVATIWKVGLGVGLFFFFLPGGSPWTGPAGFAAVMGRPMPDWPIALCAVAHFAIAIGYVAAIATAVYRLKLFGAIVAGLACGAVLFAANCLVFGLTGFRELQLFTTHAIFGLMSALAYKALSVPPPLVSDTDDEE